MKHLYGHTCTWSTQYGLKVRLNDTRKECQHRSTGYVSQLCLNTCRFYHWLLGRGLSTCHILTRHFLFTLTFSQEPCQSCCVQVKTKKKKRQLKPGLKVLTLCRNHSFVALHKYLWLHAGKKRTPSGGCSHSYYPIIWGTLIWSETVPKHDATNHRPASHGYGFLAVVTMARCSSASPCQAMISSDGWMSLDVVYCTSMLRGSPFTPFFHSSPVLVIGSPFPLISLSFYFTFILFFSGCCVVQPRLFLPQNALLKGHSLILQWKPITFVCERQRGEEEEEEK